MDPKHRKIIEENSLRLQIKIDFNKLIPYLLEYQMFNKYMWGDIQSITDLLELLPTRGPEAFHNFIEILKHADYDTEARLLQEPQVLLESENELFYKMSSTPLGYCLIINNMKFDHHRLTYREGSNVDVESLHDFFKKADFEVEVASNLKSDEMKQSLLKFSKKDFSQVDSMILIIMSHGGHYENKEILYGQDGNPDNPPEGCLKKYDVYKIFSNRNCKDLQTKPKVLIFIACRGEEKDYGVVKSRPKESLDSVMLVDIDDVILPELSDMLIINSSLPYNVTVRDHKEGTYFCKAFVSILNKYYEIYDLETMIMLVNQQLKGKVSEVFRIVQNVHTESTVEKKIMLCRRN